MRLVDAPGGGSSSNLLVTAKLGNLQPSLVDGHGVVRKTTQQVFGTATSTPFGTISEGCLGSVSPHTRRGLGSTWLPW